MHLRHLSLLNLYVCWFNSLQLIELANGASELARAYIRRARETVRTGMLIFSFSSTSRFEFAIMYSENHIVLEMVIEK